MKLSKVKVQYIISIICLLAGLSLLFMGFWVVPVGVIDNSILIAFGEILTFAGSVIGIDYHYKIKTGKGDD